MAHDTETKRSTSAIAKRAIPLAAMFGAGLLVGASADGFMSGGAPTGPAAGTASSARASRPDDLPAPDTVTVALATSESTKPPSQPSRDVAPSPRDPSPDPPERMLSPTSSASPRPVSMEGQLIVLRDELERLHRRVAALERRQTAAALERTAIAASDEPAQAPPPLPVSTPEDRYVALLSVGVDADHADEILERQAKHALARLDLRDRATREGWADSEQFREASAALRRDAVDLRGELGDGSYDLYLYTTGVANRVQIASVTQGSAAHEHGLQPGDVIEAYADRRVFNARELRETTTRGIRGESVPVQVRRGDAVMEVWLPRGPIGIGLEAVRVTPAP